MESTKKEYIDKLKRELDTIEERYQQIINENAMVGEDFRSQAAINLNKNIQLKQHIDGLDKKIVQMNLKIDDLELDLVKAGRREGNLNMITEEQLTRYDMLRDNKNLLVQKLVDA